MIRIICKQCKTVLVSRFIHDFQQCDCPNKAFADSAMIGEHEYGRYGAKNLKDIEIID